MNKGEGEANLFLEIFFTPYRPKFILLLLLYRDDIVISIPKSKSSFRSSVLLFISIIPSSPSFQVMEKLVYYFFSLRKRTQFYTHVSDRPLELLGRLPPG